MVVEDAGREHSIVKVVVPKEWGGPHHRKSRHSPSLVLEDGHNQKV